MNRLRNRIFFSSLMPMKNIRKKLQINVIAITTKAMCKHHPYGSRMPVLDKICFSYASYVLL